MNFSEGQGHTRLSRNGSIAHLVHFPFRDPVSPIHTCGFGEEDEGSSREDDTHQVCLLFRNCGILDFRFRSQIRLFLHFSRLFLFLFFFFCSRVDGGARCHPSTEASRRPSEDAVWTDGWIMCSAALVPEFLSRKEETEERTPRKEGMRERETKEGSRSHSPRCDGSFSSHARRQPLLTITMSEAKLRLMTGSKKTC